MTWNPRLDVVELLEAAGWVGDEENPLGLLRCNGAIWGVTSDGGDSSLTEPAAGETIEFPSGTPAEVIVAACLAAAEQLEDLVHKTGRLRTALASAKRRAARRQPHEREGLIFHLEREAKRLHEFVEIANAAAETATRFWAESSAEALKLREANEKLRRRVHELEALTSSAHAGGWSEQQGAEIRAQVGAFLAAPRMHPAVSAAGTVNHARELIAALLAQVNHLTAQAAAERSTEPATDPEGCGDARHDEPAA
ncbi:hypothetical protein AQJ11_02815 [Streptomyces corchorusii]|uniref:Uncharacterized protein n=2 Tax=Streptomyces TaxID=1883 RepID=A0A117QJY4_STRCK|nr:hypothetical protein [Streptomyces corchorusii]KUN32473.1 hypothetical protein AQJ11_02815 [Streptomyces corchorusii]